MRLFSIGETKVWIDEIKKSAQTAEIAKLIGAKPGKSKSFGPCPACNAESRGQSDRRKPLTIYGSGMWVCYACSAKGDVVDLVSIHLHGARLKSVEKEQMRLVRNWFASHGFCGQIGEQPSIPVGRPKRKQEPQDEHVFNKRGRPPLKEIIELWKASVYPSEAVRDLSSDDALVKWLFRRKFTPQLLSKIRLIKVTPFGIDYKYPEWWPRQWSYSMRLITPAYEPDGTVASLHGRSVLKSGPKTRWPMGYEAGGLWMANRAGVHMMRGMKPDIHGVLICEGITDLMRAACQDLEESLGFAILSGTAGSFRHIHQAGIPQDVPVFLATDEDGTGDQYAKIVIEKLKRNKIYRLNLAGTPNARS